MGDKEYIKSEGVATPSQPYNHVIRVGKTLYVAGQVARDGEGNVVGAGDPSAQAEQCWKNIEACVKSAGGTLADVVKVVCYYTDIRFAQAEIEVRRRLFQEGRWPVATIMQVANLGRENLLMEIDVTVELP